MRYFHWLIALCVFFSIGYSHAVTLQDLATNLPACVKAVSGDKLYFKEKTLHPCSEGIYIELDNDENFIMVPELSFDGQGYFLNIADAACTFGIDFGVTWWKCPICGQKNSVRTQTCINIDNHHSTK